MAPGSDTSDTPTIFTEDLLDTEQESRSIKRQHNDEVVYLRLANGKVLKMKYTILALHSPVLRLEYELTSPDGVLQVTGSEKAWKAILKLFETEDDDEDRAVSPKIPLSEVCNAMSVAKTYKMKMVEQALLLEAVSHTKEDTMTVKRLIECTSHSMKTYLLRGLYHEKILGKGDFRWDTDALQLWKSIKEEYMEEGKSLVEIARRDRLKGLKDLMVDLGVTVCCLRQCYWQDAQGKVHTASGESHERVEEGKYGAGKLWVEASDILIVHIGEDDMPTSTMAFASIKKTILARDCCSACKSELKTLFRIAEKVALERKLL